MRWIKSHKRCGVVEISVKCVPPLEKGAAKGRDRLPRRGRTLQNGKQTYGITGKRPRETLIKLNQYFPSAHGMVTATVNGASSRHSILRLWRGPSSRACSDGGKPQTSNPKANYPRITLSMSLVLPKRTARARRTWPSIVSPTSGRPGMPYIST